ncbi:GNAT family N-acetyltransferase [Chitinibacter sp. GC72]|uniref:GNAT family N-acetyltransferase n=1 Tax=Chitinibacter sp. GC72 TaxID=1526917 RepID=UPI0012FCC890|nr:GNAT family N-acetyltransferase [Chitinibacter sp. GC72]
MRIIVDDLSHPKVAALLNEHLAGMYASSPAECVYALDIAALKAPEITFLTAWDGDELLGCGAFKLLDAHHAEIKSMRTAAGHLRRGVARQILHAIEQMAAQRGVRRISLETGTGDAFLAAHRLYRDFGFLDCGPFADYRLDPFSHFMSKPLPAAHPAACAAT